MATYYISPTGNDTTGDGSSGNPWATLAKAYASSATGDTIVCKDGTYTFANATMINRTLSAENRGLAIFDASGASRRWDLSNLTIGGIRFANIAYDNGSSGIFNTTANTVTFSNCIFYGLVTSGSYYSAPFLISGAGATLVLENCVVYGHSSTTGGSALISCIANSTLEINHTAIWFSTPSPNHYSSIIKPDGTPNSLTVISSIIGNISGSTLTWYGGSTVTHSDFYNIANTPSGPGVITSDPLFIDPTNGDFHLSQNSPARGMGTYL